MHDLDPITLMQLPGRERLAGHDLFVDFDRNSAVRYRETLEETCDTDGIGRCMWLAIHDNLHGVAGRYSLQLSFTTSTPWANPAPSSRYPRSILRSTIRMSAQNQARPTIAEIDGRALAANFKELARVAGSEVGVLPVVKSDAYGHGFALVGRFLREAGADRFGVATTQEGLDLRAAGVAGPIVVLGGVYPAEYERVVESRLAPVVWEAETAAALAAIAREAGRVVPLHVKVDTGMSRLGASPANAPELIETLRGLDGVTIEGLLTHFCNAESVAGVETQQQLGKFTELVRTLEARDLRPPLVHAANSAATLSTPAAHFDSVRPGLALYGVYPSPAMRARADLRPAMRFVSGIVAIRTLPTGTGVGYGASFVTTRPSRIATVPVGYADGYPRRLSNRGRMIVRGQRVPIAGRVCMDHTMIDVTDAPDASIGDQVVLWGDALPIDEVAALAETISYELLVRVGARVPRLAI